MSKAIKSVNDFVVKFANVNGSGSASANELFARAILRMGVPVATRNIFPSNIQGLPTWFEVRVSEKGWLGRRGGCDLMVAMNPQTWDKDIASIDAGGYLFYDSSKPLPESKFRPDIKILGMPLTEICNRAYTDPRQRQLFKNIIYVGALSALLDIDLAVVEKLITEQYGAKQQLLESNIQAVHMGRDYAREHLAGMCGLTVEKADAVGDRIFVNGNDAAALGCVYGGATVAAWYPITPSTSLAESFMKYCRKLRVDPETKKNKFAIIQAEDEISAIGAVIGAGWNGARAFTATSGPGISLMQEFLGLAYFAEIPGVIFDVQRGGPSTGMPTRTQQADILLCAYASHGDTKHVLLFPEDPAELYEFAAISFDLAERLQTPIFVLEDLDIGMNDWLCRPFAWDDAKTYDRGKVMSADELESGKDLRALSRRGRRRHCLPHAAGHASHQRRLFHPRHLARPLRQIQRRRLCLRRQYAAPGAQIRNREDAGAASQSSARARKNPIPARSISVRPRRRWMKPWSRSKWTAFISTPCGCAPSLSPKK